VTVLHEHRPAEAYEAVKESYAHGEERPLASYAGLMAVYGAYAGGWALLARRRGLPDRVDARDVALVALATYKASRLVTRDKVTAPVRAPFTRFEEEASGSEVNEKPVGTGPRRAVGELLSCPFCTSQWIATTLLGGVLTAPRATRAVASLFASLAAADGLQWGMAVLRKKAEA
jgi:hypothetical protein